MPRFPVFSALALLLLLSGCGRSSPGPVPGESGASVFDVEKDSVTVASANAPPEPDVTPSEPAASSSDYDSAQPLSDGLDESGEIIAFTPDTSVPTYHGTVGESAPVFAQFLQDNLGEEVDLRVSFSGITPYDYRGGEGLSLWYANGFQGETIAGIFFECEGSFDRRTGYAAQGRIEGMWSISEVKRLGGDPHYTLVCKTS